MEPRLGTEWEALDDGMTYRVKINHDAKFHNGDPLTAEDVAWSLQYALIDGPYTRRRTNIPNLDYAKVIDDDTVEIKCTETDASFIRKIFMNGYILSKKEFLAAEEKGITGTEWVPWGTGPYVITSYNPDAEIKFTAFPDYYRGEARIKNVEISILADNNTITVGFEAGDIDFIVVPTAAWENLSNNSNYNTFLSPTNHTSFIHININSPHKCLADKRVRKALAYAINREAMCIAAYDGLATPAYSYFNPVNVYGAFTPEELKANNVEVYEYDPEKAKALLAEAGYADGCDIGEVDTINGSYWGKMSTVFQSNLKDIGVKAEITLYDSAQCRQLRKDHDYDLSTTGTNMSPDASYAYSYFRYLTDEQLASGLYTEVFPQDKELDAAFVKAMSDPDEAQRKLDWIEVNRIMQDQCYSIPTFHKAIPYAFNKDLVCEEINTNYYYVYNFYWAN
ncbi:MAG: ABC transporter substrate-binding protein [Firmicutes bacterium]|nr:ABC transporter substrate-binding protein [Bacillota bacterium]